MCSLHRVEGDWQSFPLAAVALHSGHELSPGVADFMALSEQQRLFEEDCFTDQLATIAPARVVVNLSRFEVDLNRPEGKEVYLAPQDSWGLKVWNTSPPDELVQASKEKYQQFYQDMHCQFNRLQKRFGKFLVLLIHSYNQTNHAKSKGLDRSPDVDVATWLNHEQWRPLEQHFMSSLRESDFLGQQLTVAQNARFDTPFGNPTIFEVWLNQHFPESCCLSVEFAKELFMDEQYLRVIPERFEAIRTILDQATQKAQAEFSKVQP